MKKHSKSDLSASQTLIDRVITKYRLRVFYVCNYPSGKKMFTEKLSLLRQDKKFLIFCKNFSARTIED